MSVNKEQQLVNVVSTAIESMRLDLKTDLQEFIEMAIEAHRRRVWTRSTWCCEDMRKFATATWVLPNPPKRGEDCFSFGGVTLQLRGSTVNYCPFCGVGVK